MIGHHVAQCTRAVVEITAGLDTHGFCGSDLHVIDVMVVPERLENPVRKPADQNVLDGFLAQVMIDAIDLVLAHHTQQAGVQCFGSGQVGAERLLDNHASKGVGRFLQQASATQARRHFTEEARRGGQIEHGVAGAVFLDTLGNGGIGFILDEVASDVADALGQACPQLGVQRRFGAAPFCLGLLADEVFELLREGLIRDVVVVDPHDVQTVIQQAIATEVVQCRGQQPFDQVAMGAKKENRGGRSSFYLGFSLFHYFFTST